MFRAKTGINLSEPIGAKTLLRKLKITTMYRPLSENSYGISCKSKSGRMFMMVNSNSTRGRQHFTIAHELYHLFYDESPVPHMCRETISEVERNANLFASALLLPREGLLSMLSPKEVSNRDIDLSTILKMEQLFEVSRINLLVRLKECNLISKAQFEEIKSIPVKKSAMEYGYDLSLYNPGNEGVVISDFGEKARILFERGKISEGHYLELLNLISDYHEEN
ncbi:MAG TPA: ImmA/IrrE family metallo-endopeptidase [Candidatus Coprenecus stercoravium]|uniref:ImmA/IrrE family metallo-endopeptidase n=1 Tax=Candidatus Coprenecus stercoravium TaxID=2840735 RepID=A0A9D2K9K9_9BACT|nr:ImmA/IrrE family metallo-endopeptidase [Candidatus Coprenecus stercoravium]